MSAPKRKIGLPEKRRMRHDRHFVDELTQRMGEGVGRMIRVSSISANPEQPRSTLGDVSDLVSSIQTHGVLEPLLVRRQPTQPGYELVSGHRRYRAAIEAGLSEVPCIELDVSDEQALEIALIENLQRQDLTPFEEAEGFQSLLRKHGYTHERVADAVGRSRVTVTETLKLLDIPDEIRELCRHADIAAKGLLLEIAKAGDLDAMRQLVGEIAGRGLTRADVRQRRQQITGHDEPVGGSPPDPRNIRPRPFVVRFRAPDRAFSVALSFRTEREPETQEVIAALENMIDELRADLNGASFAGSEGSSDAASARG